MHRSPTRARVTVCKSACISSLADCACQRRSRQLASYFRGYLACALTLACVRPRLLCSHTHLSYSGLPYKQTYTQARLTSHTKRHNDKMSIEARTEHCDRQSCPPSQQRHLPRSASSHFSRHSASRASGRSLAIERLATLRSSSKQRMGCIVDRLYGLAALVARSGAYE